MKLALTNAAYENRTYVPVTSAVVVVLLVNLLVLLIGQGALTV